MTRKRCRKLLRSIYSSDCLSRNDLEDLLDRLVKKYGSYVISWRVNQAFEYYLNDEFFDAWRYSSWALYEAEKTNGMNPYGEPIDIEFLQHSTEIYKSCYKSYFDKED